MQFKLINVSIDEIDFQDLSYKITTGDTVEALVCSIKEMGLLSFPYVVRKSNGKYRIVSGFNRVSACFDLGYTRLFVKVLCNTVSIFECVKLAISTNSFHRKLNIIERARCYNLLMKCVKEIKHFDELGKAIGIDLSLTSLKKLELLCSFNSNIQKGLLDGYLSLPVAFKIANMNKTDSMCFIDLFKNLNTTLNNQKEIMNMLIEVSLRDDIPIKNLLRNETIRRLLTKKNENRQKTTLLKLHLRKLRFPVISSYTEKFDYKIKQLKLNNRIKLKYSRFFEGNSFNLNITFDDSNELRNYKEDLDKIINSSLF